MSFADLRRKRTGHSIVLPCRLAIAFLLFALSLPITGWAVKQQQLISVQLSNASLISAFKEIEGKTNFGFLYNSDLVKRDGKKVTVSITDQPLATVLSLIFKNQPFTYRIEGNSIIVTSKGEGPSHLSEGKPTIDTITVTGRIVAAETGMKLAGATVILKGTQTGCISDQDGNFLLKYGGKPGAILQVRNIGYETIEISLSGRQQINIELKRSNNSLDETVVVAYGTSTNRLNTGSIGKIAANEISTQPVSNPLGALEGRIAGLYINQNTGVPGGSFSVQVRGQGSISAGTAPLYVIDGVPFASSSVGSISFGSSMTLGGNPFNSINPADIESIVVLKDADATAIYGSRGANGVLLITTKKGKAGRTTTDISAYRGFGNVSRKMNLLQTPDYLKMRREAFANDGVTPTSANARDLLIWDTTKNTDWQKEMIGGTANITDIQGSVSGGNSNTQFLLGGGYHKETTVFPGSFGDTRGSVHFNLNHVSNNQKFRITFTGGYSVDNNNLFYNDLTSYALTTPPDIPDFIDPAGNLVWSSPGTNRNPYAYLKQIFRTNTDNLIANSQLSYQVLPGLQLKTSLGYTQMNVNEVTTYPISALNPARGYTTADANSTFGTSSIKTWIIEPQLLWNRKIGKGYLDALVGTTFQQDVNQSNTTKGTGYSNEALMESPASASSTTTLNSRYSQYHYNAVFGRLNYNYQDKYILNLTARRDGSSRFGPGKKFGNFGAVGAAWIFTQESFVKDNLPFLSFGKLRGSYGTTGNDQIGDYQYLSTWSPTGYPYNGNGGLLPNNIAVPDFSWEVTHKLEAALELGFFDNRILLTTDYFRNRSSNQLLAFSIPPSNGFTSIFNNFPAVIQNTGFEIQLNTVNVKLRNISWTTSFNITIPQNKLIAFPNIETSYYSTQYSVGQPLSIVKAYQFGGVNPQTGIYQYHTAKDGSLTSSPTYPDDLQTLKKVAQQFYGGLQNSLKYKSWQLDVFFQFVKQTGYVYKTGAPAGFFYFNQPTSIMNRWQKPGDVSEYQKFTQGAGPAFSAYVSNYNTLGDNRIGDASFVRLKNIQVSYSLPAKWMDKIKMQQCRLYVQGQNLVTITSFKGLDPEQNGIGNSIYLPTLRVFTAGLQLTF